MPLYEPTLVTTTVTNHSPLKHLSADCYCSTSSSWRALEGSKINNTLVFQANFWSWTAASQPRRSQSRCPGSQLSWTSPPTRSASPSTPSWWQPTVRGSTTWAWALTEKSCKSWRPFLGKRSLSRATQIDSTNAWLWGITNKGQRKQALPVPPGNAVGPMPEFKSLKDLLTQLLLFLELFQSYRFNLATWNPSLDIVQRIIWYICSNT